MPIIQYEEHKKQYKITIPKEIIRFKRWEKGDIVLFAMNDKEEIFLKLQQ